MKKQNEESKTFTEFELLAKYVYLSEKERINVLWDALTYMEENNGRTKQECIIFAMGYEFYNNNDDETLYVKNS